VADGGVAVPAFVGVLGPVGPGRVVGKVGVEMEEVQGEQSGCCGEQEDSHEGREAEPRGFRIGMCEFRLHQQDAWVRRWDGRHAELLPGKDDWKCWQCLDVLYNSPL